MYTHNLVLYNAIPFPVNPIFSRTAAKYPILSSVSSSINDSDINRCTSRVKNSKEKDISSRVWNIIQELGVEGEEDKGVFEDKIREMKAEDEACYKDQRENHLSIP
ncbi:unnamed protein product [Vicia faba]|uniref:Uncharacterized protein n=1 Tax=Vicia faba TaxID=3906 RepID=A0AAV0ZBF8_VICFA|nr:unnamed protein product [Vicia faba]